MLQEYAVKTPECQAPPTSLLAKMQIEYTKLSRKILYYFAIDSIVNKVLIFENH